MFLKDGKRINPHAPFTARTLVGYDEHGLSPVYDEVQYPPGWVLAVTQAEREALGITEVPDPVRPDERYYFVTENDDGSITATPRPLDGPKVAAKRLIDEMCGSAREQYVSPGALVAQEYEQAYEAAVFYQAAGFTGDVPASVKSWAEAKGWTAEHAALDIIGTKMLYAMLLDAIRDVRLKGKAAVDSATSPEGIETALADARARLAALPVPN